MINSRANRIRILLLACVAVAAAIWIWTKQPWQPTAAPPIPDLDGVHAAVASAMRSESVAVGRSPRSAESWGQYGMRLMAHNFSDEALASFEQAALLDAEDFRWEFYQGQLLLDSDLESALAHFERALTLNAKHLPLLVRLCDLSLRLGDVDAASRYIGRAAVLESENPYVLLQQGRVAVAGANLEEAERHFTAAAAARGWYPRAAYVELLRLAQRTENLELGRRAAEQLTLWPETATTDMPDRHLTAVEAKNVLGREMAEQADRLLAAGNAADAAHTYEQIAEDRPELARPALNLGRALMMQGRTDEAIRIFRDTTTRFPDDPMAWMTLAHSLAQQQEFESAVESYRQAIEVKPDFADAHFSLGLLLEQTGDVDGAQQAYRQAVQANPGMPQAHLALGVLLQKAGELEEAIEHMQAAVQLVPSDPIPQSYLEQAIRQQNSD